MFRGNIEASKNSEFAGIQLQTWVKEPLGALDVSLTSRFWQIQILAAASESNDPVPWVSRKPSIGRIKGTPQGAGTSIGRNQMPSDPFASFLESRVFDALDPARTVNKGKPWFDPVPD